MGNIIRLSFTIAVFYFCFLIYSCDGLSVSHDSSEIIPTCWFVAQENIITIINVENSYVD